MPTPDTPSLEAKELGLFIERLAHVLLMQIEDENNHEHEEETDRVAEAV